jgi:hypothetical protein
MGEFRRIGPVWCDYFVVVSRAKQAIETSTDPTLTLTVRQVSGPPEHPTSEQTLGTPAYASVAARTTDAASRMAMTPCLNLGMISSLRL